MLVTLKFVDSHLCPSETNVLLREHVEAGDHAATNQPMMTLLSSNATNAEKFFPTG